MSQKRLAVCETLNLSFVRSQSMPESTPSQNRHVEDFFCDVRGQKSTFPKSAQIDPKVSPLSQKRLGVRNTKFKLRPWP